jgi:predicted chitinase
MKKIIAGASMLVGLAGCAAPGVEGSEVLGETAAAISGGTTYTMKFPNLQNKCADVNANSGANGANVQLWGCNGHPSQNWIANDKGGGWFSLQHEGTGECLNRDTGVSATTNGANVMQWTCQYDGSAEYQWSFQASNGHLKAVSRYDNKCLDVTGQGTADGTNIETWGCSGNNAQTLDMVKAGTAGIAGVIDQATFNSWFPNRKALYTYGGFVSMNNKYPDIADQNDMNLRKREVAAMLAHFAHETGDFVYTQEINPTCGCDTGRSYGCPAGSCNYFGRGWTQLTWNFNYHDAGNALGYDLLNNPGWVASDANISAQTAAWYWATQFGPGGEGNNCHQAISDSNGAGGFGQTIWHINGSLECNGQNTAQMNDRISRYKTYCDRLGCNGYGNNIGC